MTSQNPESVDSAAMAEQAGLKYVDSDEPGFRRKPWGRGFTYLNKNGEHITNPKQRERLEALAIPPAWTDVWICATPQGHIQATGHDEKGRKQYIYHPDWDKVRNEVKFNRLASFGQALPGLRAQVKKDLQGHKLSQQKVTALIVRLLDDTLLRIGNPAYAAENHSYGLTTLQNEHTAVSGSQIIFSFPGKSGKQQEATLQDKHLARLVQRCHELPGQHLFQYVGEDGDAHAIASTDVNDYLRTHTRQDFTAKEFRTWGATIAATHKLAALHTPPTEQEGKKNVVTAVQYAATVLGNTPAVCRQYYIHPAIVEAYQAGKLTCVMQDIQTGKLAVQAGLSDVETAVVHLLQSA